MMQTPNRLYDLSNPHFERVQILTTDNQVLKGRFVEFRVVKGDFENLYPAEKYCFLPDEYAQRYKDDCALNNGEFSEFPAYVKQISMSYIKEIKIGPELVPGAGDK